MLTQIFFIALILCSGYLARLSKERRFLLPKAFLLVFLESLLATILFSLLWGGIMVTGLLPILSNGVASFFTLILCNAIVVALLLYYLNQVLVKKIKLDNRVLTLAEYIIQWGLIYITIYQVIFDNFISSPNLQAMSQFEISTPTDLMVLILPSLISVWIAVILEKMHRKEI